MDSWHKIKINKVIVVENYIWYFYYLNKEIMKIYYTQGAVGEKHKERGKRRQERGDKYFRFCATSRAMIVLPD